VEVFDSFVWPDVFPVHLFKMIKIRGGLWPVLFMGSGDIFYAQICKSRIFYYNYYNGGARWPSGQCARRAYVEAKQCS
jgi:hypothetical protein